MALDPKAKPNNTGLPNQLKTGIESLSGMSMDHVKVHYNSSQPAQLNAHAYAQGSNIHVAPGQEKHLPHEAWHVVQQAQGRVKPTMQMKAGVPVNDDVGLEREADVMGARALQMKLDEQPDENGNQLKLAKSIKATTQLKMGIEWETGVTAVKDWKSPLNLPPVDLDDKATIWNKETFEKTIEKYRYAQDERIWSSGQGWVIDSDNSKLEFVTDPAVNLKAFMEVLTMMQQGANLLPVKVQPPIYMNTIGMTGAGALNPIIMHYDARRNFLGKVTGKPQITVGIKYSKLFEFIKFLQKYNLKSSEYLHKLHHDKGLSVKVKPEMLDHAVDPMPSISDSIKEEFLAQKTVMNDTKRDSLGLLIDEIEKYAATLEKGDLSAQFEHVKGLVLMNIHYAQVAMKQAAEISYKKMSFPLLMRSSFSSLYGALGEKAQGEYEAALKKIMPISEINDQTLLFKGAFGQMTFKQWVKSILVPEDRQISKVPDDPGYGGDYEAYAVAIQATQIKADKMTAPGAFNVEMRPVGSATDKSMGAFETMDKDGDNDDLVVIELRDVAHFLNKELGSYTSDVITAFYNDLHDFATGGFIKDE
ncbi:DUF4157 domain-containing protein [Shewanella sp. PP-Sp27a-2]